MTALQRPDLTPTPRWEFPAADRFTLPHGLQVALFHLPGQYVASVGLLLDASLSQEPAGLDGVATVVSGTLIEGSTTLPGAAFAEAVEDHGAVLGGSVDYSGTQVLVDVPTAHLAAALPLLAQAVAEPSLTDEAVERHAAQLSAGLAQQLATGPGIAARALRAALLDPSARESRPRAGDPVQVRAIRGADARAHHAATYGPRGALLVVSGDLRAGVSSQIADVFGAWRNPTPSAALHLRPQTQRPRALIIDRPGAVQADVRLGWPTLDRTDPRWPALQLATHAIGGAYLSRLNRVLREEKGFTYGISLVNAPLRQGGISYAQAAVRTEVLGEALTLTRGLLRLDDDALTPEEMARARDYLTGTTPLRFATASGVTGGVLGQASAGLPADFVTRQLSAYSRVTPAQATEVAAALLDPETATLVVVGEADALIPQVSDAGFEAEVRAAEAPDAS